MEALLGLPLGKQKFRVGELFMDLDSGELHNDDRVDAISDKDVTFEVYGMHGGGMRLPQQEPQPEPQMDNRGIVYSGVVIRNLLCLAVSADAR